MWDFYGGRQWVTKYVPRFGKVLEGGCGTGRYIFYLRRLGIDIEGIDFSDRVIENLEKVKNSIDPNAVFFKGDITRLPYQDNSLSGYISLGVLEHFIEGPQKPIQEAYRVLRPGGIAIITTPNVSYMVMYRKAILELKKIIKKAFFLKTGIEPFFQHEYTPGKLKRYMQQQGFHVSRAEGCDLLYPSCERGNFKGVNLSKGTPAYWFANTFENTWIKRFGAQTVTISVKTAPTMHCFLSGKLTATPESLKLFDVPISREYQNSRLARLFLKRNPVRYSEPYAISPPVKLPEKRTCSFSNAEYFTDPIFEDYGFNRNVCPALLKHPEINIELSVNNIKPCWRKRK